MFPVSFTDEEASVNLTLMQAGIKTMQGEQMDQAMASYLHIKKKIIDARNAAPKVEEVPAHKEEDVA